MKPLEKAFSNGASQGNFACMGCDCQCFCLCRCGSEPELEDSKFSSTFSFRWDFQAEMTFDVQNY